MASDSRLELKSETNWFVSVVGAIAATSLFFGCMCIARGATTAAVCGVAAGALVTTLCALWFTAHRIVFEHDGDVIRGYHQRFGSRREHLVLPLREVRDIGFLEGAGSSSVVAILESGEMQKVDDHFFHAHSTFDDKLHTLRDWFLARRYAGARPADLGAHPPTI